MSCLACFGSIPLTLYRCEARSLSEKGNVQAYEALYIDVADYFRSACSPHDETKIVQTDLPPIYFQHQGTASWNFQPYIPLLT